MSSSISGESSRAFENCCRQSSGNAKTAYTVTDWNSVLLQAHCEICHDYILMERHIKRRTCFSGQTACNPQRISIYC